ncbi:MAG: methyltransferase domain-containing protein [Planctomycetota bacterium]
MIRSIVSRLSRARLRAMHHHNGAAPRLRRAIPPGAKLDVGCGDAPREGYCSCDVRELPTIDLVCAAWEVSKHCRELAEIHSRHALEHLTFAEVTTALEDWYEALAVHGTLIVTVPNIEHHIEQFRRATWSEETLADKWSDASWGLAGLYGWQRQCDPRGGDYDRSYWDVHKSGFTPALLSYLLARAGFVDVEVVVEDEVHLVGRGRKICDKGERQVAPCLEGIRIDHRARYVFAAERATGTVLDAACGVGYGSFLLSGQPAVARIKAVDLDAGAIEYAKAHFHTEKIEFLNADATNMPFEESMFDTIVSFETIEHLQDGVGFVAQLLRLAKPGALMICSTPNQDVMEFDPLRFPYHVRHYRANEFENLLTSAGWTLIDRCTQRDSNSAEIATGWDGKYNIAVCRKPAPA